MKNSRNQRTCSLCKNHNYKVAIKNHKYVCPYAECLCFLCILAREKKAVMARQIALRRKQNAMFKSTFNLNIETNKKETNFVLTEKQKLLQILSKLFPNFDLLKLENLLKDYNYKLVDVLEFLVLK